MRKILTIIGISIIVIVATATGLLIWAYKEEQENKRIDAEAVTLKEDLTIEFGKKAKVSDFIQNLNGTLIDDYQIDTEVLGNILVSFDYINIKNKKRTATFEINTVDLTAPKIFSGNSYTVQKGYTKNLTDVLLSGDDIDDNPTRKIIGEYDFNTVGSYNLTYVVTDSSGNEAKRDFVLNVTNPQKSSTVKTPKEPNYLDDILANYKTEKTKIGIDVSKWQGEIEWEKVKNAGVEFVIIRMGYQTDYDGDYVIDPYFIQNIEGAKAAGLPVGIYFYSYAKNIIQAKEQAEWVKENLKNYEIDLPIAFDWESWNSFNTTGMSFYTINKVADVFLDTLVDSGYKGMLYGSKNYLEKIWYPTSHETWLAHYTSKTNYEDEYTIWQMSDTGRVDGINTNVDIDIMYLEK